MILIFKEFWWWIVWVSQAVLRYVSCVKMKVDEPHYLTMVMHYF